MLRAEELAVGRGEPLLEDLNLSLERGERVALTGPSGVGKSTALRALAALDPLHGGTLSLDGQTVKQLGAPRFRRRVVYVAQRARFFGGDVAEELARPFAYASASRPYPRDEAGAHLARLGLEGRQAQLARELSEGERQRVAFIRALLLAPDVLLLDEPTSALDSDRARELEAMVREAGCGVVWVSHDTASRDRLDARPLDLTPLRVSA